MLILGRNGRFERKMGTFWGSGRYYEGLKLPNSCPTVYEAQTPVTQHQEKLSPNAKKANVYGTSVNIG